MKLFLQLLIFVLTTTTISAQITKGSVLIGGTVGFNTLSEDGTSATVVNISPTAGFFLSEQFVLGSALGFTLQASEGSTVTTIGLIPFARYYFSNAGNARFFGQFNVGFQNTNSSEFDVDGTSVVIGLGIGADFFLNDHVAIEGSLGYQRLQYPKYEVGVNNIGLNFGIAAFIGRNKKN